MWRCARTTTSIGRHADKKQKEQDPKMRRHTNMRLLVQCFALSLCPYVCNGAYACIYVIVCEHMLN